MKIGKRGKRLILLGLLAVSGVGTGYLISNHSGDDRDIKIAGGGGGGGGIGAANAAMRPAVVDPLAMFADRSPGEREPGALTQTKLRERVAANVRSRREGAAPVERVLASVRERPFMMEDPALALNNSPFAPGGGMPFGGGSNFPAGTTPPVSSIAPPVAERPVTQTEAPAPPVPEPATWAMMMIGLFGLGSVLRRRGLRMALAER